MKRRVLAQLAVGVVVSATFFCVAVSSLPVETDPSSKEIEDFLTKEIVVPDGVEKRSGDGDLISEGSSNVETIVEPQRKPERISVTIFKEYKVKKSNGEYVTVQKEGGGSQNPPAIQKFIEQETGESSPTEVRVEAPKIHVEQDQSAYQLEEAASTNPAQIERVPGMAFGTEFQRVPSISYYDETAIQKVPSFEPQVNIQKADTPRIESIPTPANILNFPSESVTNSKIFIPKRKTMDGWLPIYGRRSLVRGTVSDLYHRPSAQESSFPKGTYSSGRSVFNQNSLDTASSNAVPQVIPFIQVAAAQMMVPNAHQTVTQQLQQHLIAQPQTLIPQFQSFISQAQGNNDFSQSESVIQPAQLVLSSQSQNIQQEQKTFPQPQIIPIVQPKLQFFTQNEVIPQGQGQTTQPIFANIAPQGAPITQFSQMKDLFIENRTPQDGPVPKNVVIHAQNVIIGSHHNKNESRHGENSSATASQIEEYGSTPQITAQLRQQFLVSKPPSHPLEGKPFPAGGLPLRSLAQALRNGAFSPDSNDVQPGYSRKQKNIMEITIPHTFKIKNQQTSASINQPITHGGGYGGGPPKLNNNNKGQSDYGDSVKYKTPGEVGHIDIVDTQPIGEGGYNNNGGGYGGGGRYNNHGGDGSLSHAAQDLKQRLVQMVMQELAATYGLPGKRPGTPLGQYGPPAQNTPGSGYGAPSGQYGAPGGGNHGPSNEYGAPGGGNHGPSNEYGAPGGGNHGPSNEYGAPAGGNDGPSNEYGPPSSNHGPSGNYEASSDEYGAPAAAVTTVETSGHYDNHHLSPPPIPTTLAVDFDIGSTFPKGHGSHGGGWGHDEEVTVVDAHANPDEPTAKDQIAKLGKNLFWAALDFSRKYNPITFYEKVKEFPPIRFEVYDDHHGKEHKRKDKKKRRSEKN